MKRREFLQRAGMGAAAGLAALAPGCALVLPRTEKSFELDEMTAAEMREGLASGRFNAAGLARNYLQRIEALDRRGPKVNAVIEVNPDALEIARALDRERITKGPRSPLHGIPVLIKDNIDTHDRMTTTAGSLALEGSIAPRDAFVVERLRKAGAVLLGKTNLSEWANFRGNRSISGWSGRGGQTRNPYVLDRGPSGSSSGSGAAVSANFCAVAIGTETNGSIVSPASHCGVVGIKPTVGLVSRTGIIPIAASQDTAGPMARTVADAAALLSVMAGVDPRDASTAASKAPADYISSFNPRALHGARLGVARSVFKLHRLVDPVLETALAALRSGGATLVDPIALPSLQDTGDARHQLMLYEFKAGLNDYFASLGPAARVKSLEELIRFNEQNHDRELRIFGQEILIDAQKKGPLTDKAYVEAKEKCVKWTKSFAAFFEEQKLDAVVAPTSGPAGALDFINGDRGLGGSSTYAAVSGFPNITVPCGEVFGLPIGLSFFGPAWSEAKLIGIAHAFEQATKARRAPRFLPTLDVA